MIQDESSFGMEGRLGIIDHTLKQKYLLLIKTNYLTSNHMSRTPKEVNTKQTFDLLYILSDRLTVR